MKADATIVTADDPLASDGHRVLISAVDRAQAVLGGRFLAAYALGSLAHGGFAPAVSDVDVALILTRLDRSVPVQMQRIKTEVCREIQTPLAQRLSIFWSSPSELREGTRRGRLPLVDRIDLRDHGKRLRGDDIRDQVRLPPEDAIPRTLVIEAAEFMLQNLSKPERDLWFGAPTALLALGPREVTKTILFPVRFLYTLANGSPATNAEAAKWFAASASGECRELALAALAWRDSATLDPVPDAERLLRRGLRGLYLTLISRYASRLREWSELRLAESLDEWRARLSVHP